MEHIGNILGLCRGIYWLAAEAKANKKRCRRLAERVKALQGLVETIQQRGPGQISSALSRTLWKLSMTLTVAHAVVKKYAKTKFVNLVKCKSEFNSVNEDLRDTYHVLSRALQVDQGNVMRRMFQDFGLDDDDDDWDDGPGLYGAMAPVRYPPVATPSPFLAAAAPRPQPPTAVYTAMMGVEDDTLYYAEAFFITQ